MADAPVVTAEQTNKIKLVIFGLIGVVFVGWLISLLFRPAVIPASISGSINFNGLKPTEKTGEKAQIKLLEREKGTTDEFTDTGVIVAVEDQATWQWESAAAGVTYELRADGYVGDEKITSSNVVLATAPATDLTFTFNITEADLPESMRPAPEKPETATVSGTIVINGFVPTGSFVSIFARTAGTDVRLNPVLQRIPARSGMTFSYDKATAGASYDVRTELYTSAGTFIGQSAIITVTAPALNERMTVNSTATDTNAARPASLSGVVRLRGPVVQNSTILLLQRQVGAAEFTEITRLPAQSSVNWSWDKAVSGRAFEITAALQVNEQNTASGNTVTVTAAASNVTLTIDTGVNLDRPTGLVSVDCGQPDATNHYNARINIPQNSNARLYYLEVGTAAGSSNIFGSTVRPNQSQTVFITGDSPHFARYSWSACDDCRISDESNWAGWSPTYGFICRGTTAVPFDVKE